MVLKHTFDEQRTAFTDQELRKYNSECDVIQGVEKHWGEPATIANSDTMHVSDTILWVIFSSSSRFHGPGGQFSEHFQINGEF